MEGKKQKRGEIHSPLCIKTAKTCAVLYAVNVPIMCARIRVLPDTVPHAVSVQMDLLMPVVEIRQKFFKEKSLYLLFQNSV